MARKEVHLRVIILNWLKCLLKLWIKLFRRRKELIKDLMISINLAILSVLMPKNEVIPPPPLTFHAPWGMLVKIKSTMPQNRRKWVLRKEKWAKVKERSRNKLFRSTIMCESYDKIIPSILIIYYVEATSSDTTNGFCRSSAWLRDEARGGRISRVDSNS